MLPEAGRMFCDWFSQTGLRSASDVKEHMSSAIDPQILGFESQWEPKCPFDLVVLYEDTTTRNRALTLYDRLAQRLLDECDFRSSWWQISQLTNPAFREQASDAAALANMILLCFRAGGRLPDAVRSWLDSWLPRKSITHRSALVTLIAGAPPYTNQICPVQIFLEKLARSANMDFFAHRFDESSAEKAGPFGPLDQESLAQRAHLMTPLMQEILEQQTPLAHWGINE
jgi:hypothetical protein